MKRVHKAYAEKSWEEVFSSTVWFRLAHQLFDGFPVACSQIRMTKVESDSGSFVRVTAPGGQEVARFHPSLLEVPARARYPVSYASLGYTTDDDSAPAHLAVCWWGEMEFPGHFWKLLGLPGFQATVAFGDDRIQDDDRKRLAARLWRAVSALFTPTAAPESA